MRYRGNEEEIAKKVEKLLDKKVENILNSKYSQDFINAMKNYETLMYIRLRKDLCEELEYDSDFNYGISIALAKVQCLGNIDANYYLPHILALYKVTKDNTIDKSFIYEVAKYVIWLQSGSTVDNLYDYLKSEDPCYLINHSYLEKIKREVLDEFGNLRNYNDMAMAGMLIESDLRYIRAYKILASENYNRGKQVLYLAAALLGMKLDLDYNGVLSLSDNQKKKNNMKIKIFEPEKVKVDKNINDEPF